MPTRSLSLLLLGAVLTTLAASATAAGANSPTVSVRVTIKATLPAAMAPAAERARASRSELKRLRSLTTPNSERQTIAHAQATRRSVALRRRVASLIAANRSQLNRLVTAIRHLRGNITAIDGLFGSVTTEIPRSRLHDLADLPGVAAVEPTVRAHDLSSWDSPTVSVGSPAFWAAGFLGGLGASDVRPGSLAVIEDLILRDHPDFAGVHFETATPNQKPLDGNDRHGTMVASMAVGQGISACPTAPGYTCDPSEIHSENKGVAPGAATVLDGASVTNDTDWSIDDGFSQFGWILGIDQSGVASSRVLPGASEPAQVATDSNGAVIAGEDYTSTDAETDALGDQFGLLYVQAAGNDGASLPTICRARNPLCVGAVDTGWTGDTSDDQVAPYSTRGPSFGGQKKPDLVAAGNALVANRSWQTDNQLFTTQTGTSFSTPQVAAAATLLAGSGIADPLAIKAMLIDSARPGRSTPGDPMGSQTSWQPDWGWGMLDLDQALAQRTNFTTQTISSNEAQFFASTTAETGDRATLVWNRRAAYCGTVQTFCPDGNGQATSSGLTNLDLSEHAATSTCDGAPLASSASLLDNVEQVRSPTAQNVVYRVTSGPVNGAGSEPYAIAATRQLTPVTTPIAVTVQRTVAGAETLQIGQTATLRVTTSNPSTITACAPDAQLLLDGPATIVSATTTQDPGSLIAPGQVLQRDYEMKATGPGQVTVKATGISHAYGATLSRTASAAITVAPPVVVPPPPDDGGTIPPGPNPPTELPPPPDGSTKPPVAKRDASKVRIVQGTVGRDHRTISVNGIVATHVTGKVILKVRVRIAGRTKTYAKRLSIKARHFSTKIRISTRAWKRATIVAFYARTARFEASTATRTVRRPG